MIRIGQVGGGLQGQLFVVWFIVQMREIRSEDIVFIFSYCGYCCQYFSVEWKVQWFGLGDLFELGLLQKLVFFGIVENIDSFGVYGFFVKEDFFCKELNDCKIERDYLDVFIFGIYKFGSLWIVGFLGVYGSEVIQIFFSLCCFQFTLSQAVRGFFCLVEFFSNISAVCFGGGFG